MTWIVLSISSLTNWRILVSPNLVSHFACIHAIRGMASGTSPIHLQPRYDANSEQHSNSNRVLMRCSHMSRHPYPFSSHPPTSPQDLLLTTGSPTSPRCLSTTSLLGHSSQKAQDCARSNCVRDAGPLALRREWNSCHGIVVPDRHVSDLTQQTGAGK
jgi:hypothetical protein